MLGEKVDSEIWRYLGFQVAATVCQILNLSWLPFSPKLFIKQTRFAFRQHQCLYQSIVIIIIIIQNCENDDTHFCMKRHATYFVITSDLHTCWFYEVRTENDFSFEFHAIVELLCKAMRIGTISLRDVRSLLIDFNKPTVAMTLFVWKSKNGKRDILFDITLSAKTGFLWYFIKWNMNSCWWWHSSSSRKSSSFGSVSLSLSLLSESVSSLSCHQKSLSSMMWKGAESIRGLGKNLDVEKELKSAKNPILGEISTNIRRVRPILN